MVIEKKVPRREFSLYAPSQSITGEVFDQNLVIETQNMLGFVGLSGYTANVKFAQLEQGVGGNIQLGHVGERTVNINVDAKHKNNWRACVAVLAHEICHKILQVYGLTFPTTMMNEVYTDLTTIYVGFGQLILNGYITHTVDSTQYLGYLKFDTYKVTHLLVCVIYGKMAGELTGQLSTDIFVEDAVKLWESNKDRNALLKSIYVKRGKQDAELSKNISLLEQLLKHCKMGLLHNTEQLEKQLYVESGLGSDQSSNALSAFSVIYEYCVNNQEDVDVKFDSRAAKLNKALYDAVFEIFLAYNEINQFEFSNSIICPFCGEIFQDPRVDGATAIETCPACRHHFVYDGTRWNPTVRQRELNDEKKDRQRHIDEEIRRGRSEIQRDADARVAKVRRDADMLIAEIRANEQARCKESIRKKIPRLFLPLIKKYFQ